MVTIRELTKSLLLTTHGADIVLILKTREKSGSRFTLFRETSTYTERLKCRINSRIVQELREHHLQFSDRAFSLELLGITAHVYADTFSHDGFSGVSSRGKKVDGLSFRFYEDIKDSITNLDPGMHDYIIRKKNRFFDKYGPYGGLLGNITAQFAETASGALRHGAVATFPDRPYLGFLIMKDPTPILTADTAVLEIILKHICKAVEHCMKCLEASCIEKKKWSVVVTAVVLIQSNLMKILQVQADCSERIEAWKDAANASLIFGHGGETIPEYDKCERNNQWDELRNGNDFTDALDLKVWRFYQAASLHRIYVLRDLLPKHNLIVN